MSATQSGREVAQRTFATEFGDATYGFQESDEDRAPKYQLLPTGQRANRVFVIGTLTEIENVGKESDYWQARVADPTGTFFVYAGQYQPDAAAFLEQADPPEYVAVVGKPDTYETEDEDGEPQTYVSIQPEAIRTVDAEERDKWVQETAAHTLERIRAIVDDENDAGADAEMALEQYGSDLSEYHEGAVEALESLDEDDDTE
jgi:RPA family protein